MAKDKDHDRLAGEEGRREALAAESPAGPSPSRPAPAFADEAGAERAEAEGPPDVILLPAGYQPKAKIRAYRHDPNAGLAEALTAEFAETLGVKLPMPAHVSGEDDERVRITSVPGWGGKTLLHRRLGDKFLFDLAGRPTYRWVAQEGGIEFGYRISRDEG